jgi:hypothetical protein
VRILPKAAALKLRSDPADWFDTCSQSTRVNRSTAYVNKPHMRAAFFVHDRGENMHAEQSIKFRETPATPSAVRCGVVQNVSLNLHQA